LVALGLACVVSLVAEILLVLQLLECVEVDHLAVLGHLLNHVDHRLPHQIHVRNHVRETDLILVAHIAERLAGGALNGLGFVSVGVCMCVVPVSLVQIEVDVGMRRGGVASLCLVRLGLLLVVAGAVRVRGVVDEDVVVTVPQIRQRTVGVVLLGKDGALEFFVLAYDPLHFLGPLVAFLLYAVLNAVFDFVVAVADKLVVERLELNSFQGVVVPVCVQDCIQHVHKLHLDVFGVRECH